jgi:hypothetical protein
MKQGLSPHNPPRPNKTDAGNGSKAICRVNNVLRSPSPDPQRSPNSNTPLAMKFRVAAFIAFAGLAIASPAGEPTASTKKPTFLTQLQENRLAAQPKTSTKKVYRLIIAPTWGNRFCFRIDSNGDTATLTMKRLGGQAGYGDGPLAETKQMPLTQQDLSAFENLLAATGYEKMDLRDPHAGLDGDSWTLEVSKPAYYHIASRWCPNAYRPDKRGTRKYADAFRWVADKMSVTKSITNKGHGIFDR